jgi:hypothetical protein
VGDGRYRLLEKDNYLMSLRNAYRQKLTAQVEEQRAKLGVLKAHAKRVAADGRIVGYEELAHAERSLGQFASKLKQVAGAGLHALAEVKGGVGKALDDLTVSTKRAASRFSERTARPQVQPATPKPRGVPARPTQPKAVRAAASPKAKTTRPAKRRRVGGRAGAPAKL